MPCRQHRRELLFFCLIQGAPSHSMSTHNQFVLLDTYEIEILDSSKMSHHYFLIKLYDLSIDQVGGEEPVGLAE